MRSTNQEGVGVQGWDLLKLGSKLESFLILCQKVEVILTDLSGKFWGLIWKPGDLKGKFCVENSPGNVNHFLERVLQSEIRIQFWFWCLESWMGNFETWLGSYEISIGIGMKCFEIAMRTLEIRFEILKALIVFIDLNTFVWKSAFMYSYSFIRLHGNLSRILNLTLKLETRFSNLVLIFWDLSGEFSVLNQELWNLDWNLRGQNRNRNKIFWNWVEVLWNLNWNPGDFNCWRFFFDVRMENRIVFWISFWKQKSIFQIRSGNFATWTEILEIRLGIGTECFEIGLRCFEIWVEILEISVCFFLFVCFSFGWKIASYFEFGFLNRRWILQIWSGNLEIRVEILKSELKF